jgi:predicted flap endonuclease-1-like 5' DNA nuclease
MTELLNDYWPLMLVALAVALIAALIIFRPRQRDRSMSASFGPTPLIRSKSSSVPAAACDISGEIIGAPVHRHLSAAAGTLDDFERIKGVGPKLADMLRSRGFTRFEQLAHLTAEEIDLLDDQLGPFRGRIRRDRIAEQATYLARGDIDGFEQHFGKLS